jgi:hypothetical protein
MDKFNSIGVPDVSKSIIANTPYSETYSYNKKSSIHYRVFKTSDQEILDVNLSSFARDTIYDLKIELSTLGNIFNKSIKIRRTLFYAYQNHRCAPFA